MHQGRRLVLAFVGGVAIGALGGLIGLGGVVSSKNLGRGMGVVY